MRDNVSTLSTKIIQIGLVLIAFLTPVFFLTTTSEFYNFNKTTLLIVSSFFLFAVWGAKMVADKKVTITRTPLDVPILIFLSVYILATLFSIDPVISVLGWHPVFFGSLPSVAALVILYFLATSHLDSTYRQAVMIAFVVSASILATVTIAYYFGFTFIQASWAKSRIWTPAGDLNTLASFLAVSIPLTISLGLFIKEQISKYLLYILAGVQILAFAYINSLFAYALLAVSGIFILLLLPRLSIGRSERTALGVLTGLVVVMALVINVSSLGNSIIKPFISGSDKSLSLATPVRLPLSAAWQTSAQALASRPIFGSGPSTYGIVFPSFKPVVLNAENKNNLWNIRFDQPNSALLNVMTTSGVAGLLAFLFILFVLVKNILAFSSSNEVARKNTWFLFLQGSLIAGMAGFFLFDMTPITGAAFFILAAAFYSTLRDLGSNMASDVNLQLVALRNGAIKTVDPNSRHSGSDALAWTFLAPAVLLLLGILFLTWTSYSAELSYEKAIVASQTNKGKDTRDNLVAAIKANPYRDTYHRALLVTDLALARALNQKGNLKQEEQNTLLALVQEGIDQGRVITGYEGRGIGSFSIKRVPGTASLNVANWESIGTLYSNIGGQLQKDASVHAINTFSQAIRLDPTNPRLYEALGNVYFNVKDNDNAIKNFELAVSVKPDYASGHYNLAQAVKRKGDNPSRVVNELSATVSLVTDKATRERVQKELDDAKVILNNSTKSATPKK